MQTMTEEEREEQEELKGLYGPTNEFKFDLVVKDHDWAIRSLRKEERKDQPWFKSKSLKEEFEMECQTTPGFGDLVRKLLGEASDAPEDEQPGLDPRFQIIRDFVNEKAREMGHSFLNSTVTTRTRYGAVYTVDLNPE